uniref:Ion transport domain-containing protein n=1 Tax=Pygocentrus nattereri TaxID=42514 RepID=A0AAR2LZY2_PYGNA
MKATLLVLLLSAVAGMLTCDHQHSEQEAGPGCPLGKRLAFDRNTTLEESKRLNNEYFDCPNPEPGAPCFYYGHVFYPFFVIEDTVVGESDRFHDSYTFKVVGGGRTRESVRNYSQEEILKFNSLRDSESYQQTLVWTFDDVPDSFPLTKEGFIVMRGASNRVRWLCQRNSPCGDLTPVNHLDPEFYFVVEVSNMETAGSPFCEYTVRFELHVHGFPLDPVRALFFHQMTMTFVQTILICYIGHCWRLKRKTVYTKTRDGLDEQGWCLSAVNSCLLVFYVLEALFKILIQGRTYFRNPWNDLDFFIVLMSLLDFVLSLVQSGGGFSSRQASTLFRVLKTLKGARVFRALRLLKAIRFFKGLQAILLTCLQSFRSMSSILVLMFLFLFIFAVVFREMFNESDPEHFGSIFRTIFTLFQILTLDDWSLIYMTSRDNGAPHIIYFMSLYILVELFTFLNLFIAVLVDNFQLSICKKRHHKSQKSPDVKEGEAQSTKKAVEDLDVSRTEIEEEFYKEALRHASSDGKHSKRKIELTKRYLQLLAAMDQHMQKYRSQACLLDNLVETFFMDQDEETRSDAVE